MRILTTTEPGPGSGVGTCFRTNGPFFSSCTSAFMVGGIEVEVMMSDNGKEVCGNISDDDVD